MKLVEKVLYKRLCGHDVDKGGRVTTTTGWDETVHGQ